MMDRYTLWLTATYLVQALSLVLLVAFSAELPAAVGRGAKILGLAAFTPFGIFLLGWMARRTAAGWPQLVSMVLMIGGVTWSWYAVPLADCMVFSMVMLVACASAVFSGEVDELPAVSGALASAPRITLCLLGLAGQLGLLYLLFTLDPPDRSFSSR